jgi:VWFA-related protein
MSPVAKRYAATFIVILLALTSVLRAQRGGGGGGGAGASRGATSSPPRGNAPAGQRGPAGPRGGQRGDQPRKKNPDDDLKPNDGLTLAYVSVTGKDHHSFPGLTRSNFRILEDNVEQEIEYFAVEANPITIGFVLGGPPNESRGIPLAFLKATPWEEEYFILVDQGHPPGGTVIQSFTTDVTKATHTFLDGGVSPDTIDVGLDYLKEAANHRKILLLVGGTLNTDDVATTTLDPDRILRQATRQDVQVYSILTSNDGSTTFDDGGTSDISPLTGGRGYISQPFSYALEKIAEEIAHGLAVQYEVGYRSTNPTPDGKWRKIHVDLVSPPETAGKLDVWTKSGFYVDKQKRKK